MRTMTKDGIIEHIMALRDCGDDIAEGIADELWIEGHITAEDDSIDDETQFDLPDDFDALVLEVQS